MNILKKSKVYKKYSGAEQELWDIKNQYKGLVSGSSYSYWGFRTFAQKNGFLKIAFQPQTISYDARLYKEYKNHLKDGSAVLLTIMPCSFLVNEYEDLKQHERYYSILSKENIYKYSPFLKLKTTIWPIARCVFRRKPHDAILKQEDPNIASNNMLNGWLKEFGIEKMEDATTDKNCVDTMNKVVNTLSNLITEIIKDGHKPYIILMPVSSSLKKLIPEAYYESCVIKNVNEANKDRAEIIDLYHRTTFEPTELYANGYSLNDKGNELLNDVLVKELGDAING